MAFQTHWVALDIISINNMTKKNKTINPKNILSFIIFIILSGLFGLIASSFFLNFMSDSFQNQSPQIELLEKD